MRTIVRVRENDGEIFVLRRGSDGYFEVGDPQYASDKDHPDRRRKIKTLEEVISLAEKGFSVRLCGIGSEESNMISAGVFRIIEIST